MTNYSELVKTVNIPELVKALRQCVTKGDLITICDGCPYKAEIGVDCENNLHKDAAAAIEDLQAEAGQWKAAVKGQEDGIKVLQAEVKRLKECNDELREAQTYIDHYGDKWMTSAKDVPTSAYNHGYMDGKNEAGAAQPHWVSVEDELPEPNIQCLVRDDDCNYAVGYYRQDVKAWDSPFFGWLERDDEYYKDGDLCRIGKVVAWMPLPEPTQEGNDGN